jgi:hypothetical protein
MRLYRRQILHAPLSVQAPPQISGLARLSYLLAAAAGTSSPVGASAPTGAPWLCDTRSLAGPSSLLHKTTPISWAKLLWAQCPLQGRGIGALGREGAQFCSQRAGNSPAPSWSWTRSSSVLQRSSCFWRRSRWRPTRLFHTAASNSAGTAPSLLRLEAVLRKLSPASIASDRGLGYVSPRGEFGVRLSPGADHAGPVTPFQGSGRQGDTTQDGLPDSEDGLFYFFETCCCCFDLCFS